MLYTQQFFTYHGKAAWHHNATSRCEGWTVNAWYSNWQLLGSTWSVRNCWKMLLGILWSFQDVPWDLFYALDNSTKGLAAIWPLSLMSNSTDLIYSVQIFLKETLWMLFPIKGHDTFLSLLFYLMVPFAILPTTRCHLISFPVFLFLLVNTDLLVVFF